MRRRFILGALGATLAGATPGISSAAGSIAPTGTIFADTSDRDYRILVGGLPGGRIDRWAHAISLGVQAILSPEALLRVQTAGGRDGVTGANRLQALVAADGHTGALLPGAAPIAYLTGDPRVHFRPGEWIPILAGINPGVIVVRGGLARLAHPSPLRLAAAAPESPDLAAILAFERLGVPISPIFGLRDISAVARAFRLGEADAVLLAGEDIPADMASLQAANGSAICTLGSPDQAGGTRREQRFPALPTVEELASSRRMATLPAPLERAYQAVVAASRLDFILILPRLTPAVSVALWRQAALGAIGQPALQSAAAASAIALTVDSAGLALAPITAPPDALLALRQFLFTRFGWRPN
ncbi:MAG: hypothetical protein B7Z59_05045 [Acidiphilium sp. 37-67-22]|nr:MAG: hypothetical protein B7Z59_05045 [Acidiphilium sp. 37-67-22]